MNNREPEKHVLCVVDCTKLHHFYLILFFKFISVMLLVIFDHGKQRFSENFAMQSCVVKHHNKDATNTKVSILYRNLFFCRLDDT